MNNANYLIDTEAMDWIYRFLELSKKFRIQTIVLHTNHFQSLKEFRVSQLEEIRDKYMNLFRKLDKRIDAYGVKIGVENMPIIGDHGNDFDSIFVLPDDFNGFNFKNIGITWDFGHWAYTYFVIDSLKNLSTAISTKDIVFDDYLRIKDKIIHTHLSSFRGATYPYSNSSCEEGIPPQGGTINPEYLSRAIKQIDSWKEIIKMTLEIREDNYIGRKKIYETIEWIKNIGNLPGMHPI